MGVKFAIAALPGNPIPQGASVFVRAHDSRRDCASSRNRGRLPGMCVDAAANAHAAAAKA
jgi:hypothetical protein